jgi:hypothetical protein
VKPALPARTFCVGGYEIPHERDNMPTTLLNTKHFRLAGLGHRRIVAFLHPPLTTAEANLAACGAEVIGVLDRQMRVAPPCTLVMRASTGVAPSGRGRR